MRHTSILTVLLLTALASCAAQSKPADALVQGALAAKLSLADAVKKGVQEAGSGVPYQAELELDGGKAVWSIDVAQDKKTCNVVLDSADGKVVEKDTEDEDESATVAACKVSLLDAVAAASAVNKGATIEAAMRVLDGKPFVDVVLLEAATKTTATVRVDGVSGKVVPVAATAQGGDEKRWTDVFHTTPDEFATTGRSTFMILEPGYKLTLQGKEGSESVELIVTVLPDTKRVDGIDTRVVEERESKDGKLVEVSRNYFAISKRSNCVYYFGEDVDMYEDGKVVSHEGAWLSGQNGARYGLFMPGQPLLGARFYQEVAPGVAMDRAEIVSVAEHVVVPYGQYDRVLKYEETTPLEKAKEYKWFAPGIGLIQDAGLKLVRVEK
jgi:hypothetical protein